MPSPFYRFLALWLVLCPLHALASPVKIVGTPVVQEGLDTIESRNGVSYDEKNPSLDGRIQSRLHLDHAFNDSYALRFIVFQDWRGNDSREHEAVAVENRFQVFERREHGFDGGFRLAYYLRDGDKKPDIAEFRWLNLFPVDPFEFRHQIILQHGVGTEADGRGIAMELRWQATYHIPDTKHRLGVEMFNEFQTLSTALPYHTQSHDAGPVIYGPLAESLRYQIGYRYGLSEAAANHAVKLFIGYDF